jgi:hypothetical protein
MTQEELQIKFDALAEAVLSPERRAQLRDAIFGLEKVERIADLMALCVADR